MLDRLEGHERTLYEDHVGAAAAHHLALVRDRDACYVVFRRDRRKGLPLFASLIYVGNPALFEAGQQLVYRHLLLRHRIPFTLVELRVSRSRPRLAVMLRSPRPKMYRSPTLAADQIDYLYSELTCVSLVRFDCRSGCRAPDEDEPASPPRDRRALGQRRVRPSPIGRSHATYGELWARARQVAGGLAELGLERGDRVAVFLEKRIETVAAIFGTSAAGGVFVPVNPCFAPHRSPTSSATATSAFSSPRPNAWSCCRTLEDCPRLEHVVLVGDVARSRRTATAIQAAYGRDRGRRRR